MPIPIVPFDDRQAFWKFQNASCTFDQVRATCQYMLDEKIEQDHVLHVPLQTALHVLYGKPFKQRRQVRIPEDIVPAEFANLHGSLIMMRDKIHAHTDSDGPLTVDSVALNKVLVLIRGGEVRYGSTYLFPRLNSIQKISELAKELSEKMSYHAEKIWKKHIRKEYVSSGNFSVNLAPGDGPFFETLDWGRSAAAP